MEKLTDKFYYRALILMFSYFAIRILLAIVFNI